MKAANLNRSQCGIIMRLMTGHIELNEYLYNKQMKCPKLENIPINKKCDYCKCNETINHFILKCKRFQNQREILRNKLVKINHRFKYNKFFTIPI